MATLVQLTKLFQALAARDWQLADAMAREIARSEEGIGHHAAAQRLRGALHPNGNYVGPEHATSDNGSEQSGRSTFFLSSALKRLDDNRELRDLRLRPATRKAIEEITTEWTHREKLSARQISRRTKLLFHGPPGCGKSITARALGHELGIPVYVVRFDAVVGAYLGQTALHLRQLFRFAETTPCILLIDEIDALGKRRGNPLDVGELDRVVIALLQELEHSLPLGLLVATSNLARQLDDALWRRFDLVLEFPRPGKAELDQFFRAYARSEKITVSKKLSDSLRGAKSYADAQRLIESEKRKLALKA